MTQITGCKFAMKTGEPPGTAALGLSKLTFRFLFEILVTLCGNEKTVQCLLYLSGENSDVKKVGFLITRCR